MTASFTITRRTGDTYEVLVDDADLPTVKRAEHQGRWHVTINPTGRVVVRRIIRLAQTNETLGRFLMELHNRPNPARRLKWQVMHRNGNPLDFRMENLFWAGASRGKRGRVNVSRSSSGCHGVSEHECSGKWEAYVWFGGRKRAAGLHHSVEAACGAVRRMKAAIVRARPDEWPQAWEDLECPHALGVELE